MPSHTFRVWAPETPSVELAIYSPNATSPSSSYKAHPMKKAQDLVHRPDKYGWWELTLPDVTNGTEYGFIVQDNKYGVSAPLPDPRAQWLPVSVHGPSKVLKHEEWDWKDTTWRGVPLAGSVLYELHVGTFTKEGTFEAIISKLDYLVDLGIDAIELLPCNSFPGQWNWGYDGVGLFAPQQSYGGPGGLKQLVEACHLKGIGVVMDVVYNHLGPDGNYLECFGPYFSTKATAWGTSVNLDGAGANEVRSFFIDNALMWLRDYHIDGLRLDAVHALSDTNAIHFLEELQQNARTLSAQMRKPIFLVAESDLNDPKMIRSVESGGYGLDGQWVDDVHHSLHATLTGERQGYYGDFGSIRVLCKALSKGFVHDGEWSSFRKRNHGRPIPPDVPSSRLVVFLQDHDQIGNRATGDRISATLSLSYLKIGAALLLTSPFTPMLFQGEEWGAKTPFQFFTNHNKELGEAVKKGRRAEFAEHGWNSEDIPDPQDPETFNRSKLDWTEKEKNEHKELLEWYKTLIRLRRKVPELNRQINLGEIETSFNEQERWLVITSGDLNGKVALVVNFGKEEREIHVAEEGWVDGHDIRETGKEVLASSGGAEVKGKNLRMGPESVAVVRLFV